MSPAPFNLDFQSVAAAALSLAHVLLPEWIGGKRQGSEWLGEKKANGGLGDSWSVNVNTGRWACFADSNVKGGDLISLYAALHHLEQGAALKEVAKLIGMRDRPASVPVLEQSPPTEDPCEPIPAEPPPIRPHNQYGEPTATYRYGDAFVVLRYDTPGGKQFRQMTWRGGKWVSQGYPGLKPLFGVERLAERPDAAVLIVEGEKCALAAAKLLRAYVVLTWAGGANAYKKSNWKPLKGRDVVIWPDADEAGSAAGAKIGEILSKYAVRVRTIQPHRDDGWDIADAIAEGWSAKQATEWASKHIRHTFPAVDEPAPTAAPDPGPPVAATTPDPAPEPAPEPRQSAPDAPQQALAIIRPVPRHGGLLDSADGSAPVGWHTLDLDCGEGGQPYPTIANASVILQAHPRLKGHIWYDRFTGKIYQDLKGPTIEWSDDDDVNLTVSIQHAMRLPKFHLQLIQSAVGHAARLNSHNSLTEWLGALEWDGTERLDHWLSDCLGVEKNDYSMAIGRNWPISMVARAYVPGCQVDTMPVLEGKMGRGKSSFLAALGRPWYASLPVAFGDKDFLQAIQGNWLIEIPDMTGFSRREHTQILATITIRTDVYRPSYGRRTISHPRTAVFAATSETDDYLQDARGRRRYWPLRCADIDLDALAGQRDQIFAEAVAKYRDGHKWYEMPPSADDEQTARAAPDLWTDKVIYHANMLWDAKTFAGPGQRVTSVGLLKDAIDLPLGRQSDIEKKRIARIMRENGWVQMRDSYGRFWKKLERRDGAYSPPLHAMRAPDAD